MDCVAMDDYQPYITGYGSEEYFGDCQVCTGVRMGASWFGVMRLAVTMAI